MRAFALLVAGVGDGRHPSAMDPTFATILAAVVGAAVTHYRAKADWEEMARAVQRDAAGALVAATQDYAWELNHFRLEHEGKPPSWATEVEAPERYEEVHRRFQVDLNPPGWPWWSLNPGRW